MRHLVAQPRRRSETIGAKTHRVFPRACEVSDSILLSYSTNINNSYLPATNGHSDTPFVGGALGYFSLI
ncbi:hypothetical protein OH492_18500 [Vibrio chagasii]|nr:hypothetical protein [Vibrio chagasii]